MTAWLARLRAPTRPLLVAWAGGPGALHALIDAFHDRVESDNLLAPFFPGGVSRQHRQHVADWWVEVFDGPATCTKQHGGYARMLAHHRGLGITPEQRRRFVSLMSVAADGAGLPDDPEFRSAVLAYVEWGTRLALLNSQPGTEVVEQAPSRAGAGASPRPGPASAQAAARNQARTCRVARMSSSL